ncbi:hypothetical protein [Pseudomonas extremaustralis]
MGAIRVIALLGAREPSRYGAVI